MARRPEAAQLGSLLPLCSYELVNTGGGGRNMHPANSGHATNMQSPIVEDLGSEPHSARCGQVDRPKDLGN